MAHTYILTPTHTASLTPCRVPGTLFMRHQGTSEEAGLHGSCAAQYEEAGQEFENGNLSISIRMQYVQQRNLCISINCAVKANRSSFSIASHPCDFQSVNSVRLLLGK